MFQSYLRLRFTLLIFVVFLVPFAYWLRFYAPIGPTWRDSTGGAAYVVFWSAILLIICPHMPAATATGSVLLATCGVEFLQLWHPSWLEAIRMTLAGRLVLGTTFDWSDFPPYFAGAALSWLIFVRIKRRLSAI